MGEQLVIVALGDEEYAFPIENVREITRFGEVRPIPEATSYIKGLINIRGKAIPLINMHMRFGIKEAAEGSKPKKPYALITDFKGILVGLCVDKVSEVSTIEDINPAPPLVTVPFIEGVINLEDRIIMKINLEQMLKDSGLQELDLEQ